MSHKACPHCGNPIPLATTSCPCGYVFLDDEIDEALAPGIVRSSSRGEGQAAVRSAVEPKKAPPKPQVARKTAPPVAKAEAQAARAAQPNTARIMDCPSCGARISKRAPQCPKCGSAPFMPCQICAAPILANSTPCTECGDPDPFDTGAA